MCSPSSPDTTKDKNISTLKSIVALLSLSTIALLGACIALAIQDDSQPPAIPPLGGAGTNFLWSASRSSFLRLADLDDNVCAGATIAIQNKLCADLDVVPGQAGANVTKGFVGNLDAGDVVPNTKPYFQSNMCPVNVHWHLGTEHYSYGEFDENGNGPSGNQPRPDWAKLRALRELQAGNGGQDPAAGQQVVRDGFRCHHYDANDAKFTTPYTFQHCFGMQVGETYEVHWPHSSAGACGTPNQYQTPFYDGVFCNLPKEAFVTLGAQDIASNVGVHGQVFTIVNDESYFYPDMIKGMVIDERKNMGQDVHYYTGSTTGPSRNNQMCSQYAPITWQVDRKCHLISASSFDKLCYDMKMQRDDMSGDLHAHGSRELVHDDLASNNQHYPEEEAEEAVPAAEEVDGNRNLRA